VISLLFFVAFDVQDGGLELPLQTGVVAQFLVQSRLHHRQQLLTDLFAVNQIVDPANSATHAQVAGKRGRSAETRCLESFHFRTVLRLDYNQ